MYKNQSLATNPLFYYWSGTADIILIDSGGMQEEVPSLGKPVLVMRDIKERPQAVDAGTVKLVGTDFDTIVNETTRLLNNDNNYHEMSSRHNPYGDGLLAGRIADFIYNKLRSLN